MTHIGTSSRRARIAAMGLGSALAMIAATPAYAANECGALVSSPTHDAQVVCAPKEQPYAGIGYDAQFGYQVTLLSGAEVGGPVSLTGGSVIDFVGEHGTKITADAPVALAVASTAGPVSVQADEVMGTGTGIAADAQGNVSVAAGKVQGRSGIRAASSDGNVVIVADKVKLGDKGTGIHGTAGHGDVRITAGQILADNVGLAYGIYAASQGGLIAIDAGKIWMTGNGNNGASAWTMGDGANPLGDIYVTVDDLIMEGSDNTGIEANFDGSGEDVSGGNIAISAGTIAMDGDSATGILATANGNLSINAQSVVVRGNYGEGISAWAGNAVEINAGNVQVLGDAGTGIFAGGSGDVSISADRIHVAGAHSVGIGTDIAGSAILNIGELIVSGEEARGAHIYASGSVDASIGHATAEGDGTGAVQIAALGDIQVDLGHAETFGADANALTVNGDGGVTLISVGTAVTHGEGGDGALALWTAGDIAIDVREKVASEGADGIKASTSAGAIDIIVRKNATVSGRTSAITASATDGVSITIEGQVKSAAGPVLALSGSGGSTVKIGAAGTLYGYVALTEGNDVITNDGRLVLHGDSNFGGGNDTLVNNGTISFEDIASGPGPVAGLRAQAVPAAIPAASLLGLEKIDNRGLIDLANGKAGDKLQFAGELAGGPGSAIAVDIGADGTSDLVSVGRLSGVTSLELHMQGQGSFSAEGLKVVESAAPVTGKELVIDEDSASQGFVQYGLAFDAATQSWKLLTELSQPGYRAAILGAGARDLWREGFRALSTQMAATRASGSEGGHVWAQALAGENDRSGSIVSPDGPEGLGWKTKHEGIQFGAGTGGNGWQVGVTGGFGNTDTDFGDSETTAFKGSNLGLYAGYSAGSFFANGMLRMDWLKVDTRWGSVDFDSKDDATMVGAAAEAGYHAALGAFWLEPSASLQWSTLNLPDLEGSAGTAHFMGGSTIIAEAGMRAGMDGLPLRPELFVAVAHEAGSNDRVDITVGGDTVRVRNEDGGTYGRAGLTLSHSFGMADLYAQGEGRFGDVEGVNGVVGARVRF